MKTSTKILLGSALTAGALGCAVGYAANFAHELLLNRDKLPSDGFATKITGNTINEEAEDVTSIRAQQERNRKWLEEYGYERHYIISDRGEKLTGYLIKTEKKSNLFAFCAHGYRYNARDEFCHFAELYLSEGINVFCPDHVASGESEGTHCSFGYYESDDCIKWLHYLIDTFGEDIKITLHGVSMGAATVMMMSGREDLPDNVKMAVSDCGYSSAIDEFTEKLVNYGVPAKPIITVINAVSKTRKGVDFYTIRPMDNVQNAKIPMLFIHGTEDNFVPSYMAEICFEMCGSEHKDLLLVEGAAHTHSYFVDKENYEKKVRDFLNRFVK